MIEDLTGWETTRLSKHFILLDFLADHSVYRYGRPLPFDKIWNGEHEALAKGLCNDLLEPLMRDERVGPISVADAFWPSIIPSGHSSNFGPKHRWTEGEATADIALYKLVDKGKRGSCLKKIVEAVKVIDGCRDRVISYPNSEFLCVTFKPEGARKCGSHGQGKAQNLRAHHVRVGRYFNLLDFCRNGRAVEKGIDLVPKNAESSERAYFPIPEETAARSFTAVLDPLVKEIGRISVVRGMETAEFADDEFADLHRWDRGGPWRLVFVLPRGADPEKARDLLKSSSNVREVLPSRHASKSYSLALVVDQMENKKYRGMRPIYLL